MDDTEAKKVCIDWDKTHVGVAVDMDGASMAYGPFSTHWEAVEWARKSSQNFPTVAFTFLTLRPADAIGEDLDIHVRTVLRKVDDQQDRSN